MAASRPRAQKILLRTGQHIGRLAKILWARVIHPHEMRTCSSELSTRVAFPFTREDTARHVNDQLRGRCTIRERLQMIRPADAGGQLETSGPTGVLVRSDAPFFAVRVKSLAVVLALSASGLDVQLIIAVSELYRDTLEPFTQACRSGPSCGARNISSRPAATSEFGISLFTHRFETRILRGRINSAFIRHERTTGADILESIKEMSVAH